METTVSIPLGYQGNEEGAWLEDIVIFVDRDGPRLVTRVVGSWHYGKKDPVRLDPIIEAFCEHFIDQSQELQTEIGRIWVDKGGVLPTEGFIQRERISA